MNQTQFWSQTALHCICSFSEEYQGHLGLLMLFVAGRKLRFALGGMATEHWCAIRAPRNEERNSLEWYVPPEREREPPCPLHVKWSSKHDTLGHVILPWIDFHWIEEGVFEEWAMCSTDRATGDVNPVRAKNSRPVLDLLCKFDGIISCCLDMIFSMSCRSFSLKSLFWLVDRFKWDDTSWANT